MKYQVPQFVDVEDKIFGPLTLKQFLYLAGGIAIGFLLWSFLPRFLAILIGIPVVGFFFMLAFYEYNGRPFIYTVENFFKYSTGDKLYIWKKEPKKIAEQKTDADVVNQLTVPKISDSKLKELTWSLDVSTKVDQAESEKNLGLRI